MTPGSIEEGGRARSVLASRALGGLAVAILVVGAGGAIGMGGSSGSPHRPASSARLAGPGAAKSPSSGPIAPVPTTGLAQTTTSTTTSTATTPSFGGGPTALSAGSSSEGPGDGTASVASGSSNPVGDGTPAPSTAITTTPTTAAGSTGSKGALPANGTYEYQTSGSQQISVFGSSNYPSQTSIVVTPYSCGVSSTWRSSPGDSETIVECPAAGGIRVVSESTTVSSGGYAMTQAFTCDPDAFIPVTSGQVGQTWSWQCSSTNGEKSSQVVKLLGPRSAVVGGITVNAVEVSVVSNLSGTEQGTADSDYWLTSNATPVKETGNDNVSMGAFTYTSHFSLQLNSLTPSG